jgi:hypothetical protein
MAVGHNKFRPIASKILEKKDFKENTMKKAIILLVLVSAVVLTSCSSYSCPTYSKAPQKASSESRI